MSRGKAAIKSVLLNWTGKLLSFVIIFVLTPIFIRELGDEQYGVWAIIMSFSGYYAISHFGILGAIVKFLAEFHATEDEDQFNRIFVTGGCIFCVAAGIVVVASSCVAGFAPWIIKATEVPANDLRLITLLCGIAVAILVLSEIPKSVLQATGRFDIINFDAVFNQLVRAVAFIVLLKYGFGLVAVSVAMVATAALSLAVVSGLTKRAVPSISCSRHHFSRDTLRQIAGFSGLSIVQGFSRRASKSAGPIITGAIVGPAATAFYAIAESLADKTAELSRAITMVTMPMTSQLEANKNREALIRTFAISTRVLTLMAVLFAVGFICWGSNFIDIWIREGFSDRNYPVLVVLFIAMVVRLSAIGPRSMLCGTQRIRVVARAGVVELVMTLALGVGFTWQLGIIGMAIAVLAAQLVTAGILIPFATADFLQITKRDYFHRAFTPVVASSIPIVVVAVLLRSSFDATNYIEIGIQASLVGLVAVAACFALCLDREVQGQLLCIALRKQEI